MTLPYLQELAKEQKGYSTPELNDHLYLHYKGFSKLSPSIGAYFGLKTLWLEGNALSQLEYLGTLASWMDSPGCLSTLTCFFVHYRALNFIKMLVFARKLLCGIAPNCPIKKLIDIKHLK
jgi:hypothetical protein